MGERLARSTAVRFAFFALLAAALVWPLLDRAAYTNEFRDAQVLGLHERVAALTVAKFRELPLWNPYYCGGLYALGAPQSRFASPAFLATLLFGVERAQPLVMFVLAVLGMEGTYRWLRLRIEAASAAVLVAPMFVLSGQLAVAVFRGWTTFFGFALLPFVLLGVTLAARGRTRGLALASLAFALILGFGGTFAAPLVAVAAVAEGLRALSELPKGRRLRGVVMLASAALFMATVSAVRLWPVAETLAASPRIMAGTPGHLPKHLLSFLWESLDVKDGDVTKEGSFYVGPLFLALVALGGADRKSARALVLAFLFLWIAAGYARKPAIFDLLRRLPVFSALRYPERFLWISILFACEPAARAIVRVPRLGDSRSWRMKATGALVLAALATIALELRSFVRVADGRMLGAVVEARAEEFRQTRGNRWLAAHFDGAGLGSLSCWETHPVVMSPRLRGDLAAEEYASDPAAGSVTRLAWSPNALTLRASFAKPARLVVNQNWHPGWRSSAGRVVSHDGLLAVELPSGTHEVRLAFRPVSAWGGAIVTCVALLALAYLGVRARRGRAPFVAGTRTSSAIAVLAPAVAFAAIQATRDEPPFPPPPLVNANGLPALVTSTDGAPVPNVKLDAPVTIEGLRVAPVDANLTTRIDLYLRRTGPMDKRYGVFVHLERREGQEPPAEKKESFVNLDHQVVGGSFYLSEAPLGALVHDSFGASFVKMAKGEWDLKLGVGPFSGRGRKETPLVTVATITVP